MKKSIKSKTYPHETRSFRFPRGLGRSRSDVNQHGKVSGSRTLVVGLKGDTGYHGDGERPLMRRYFNDGVLSSLTPGDMAAR